MRRCRNEYVRGADEHGSSDDVSSYKRDSTTDSVEEQDTDDLTNDTHGVIDTVDEEGVIGKADRSVDGAECVSVLGHDS